MSWVMPIASIAAIFVAVFLAVYGWILLMWLAKRREAYDLYCSAIATLQQLVDEGIETWRQGVGALDRYTEQRLTMKLGHFERMLDLLRKHYYKNSDARAGIEEEIRSFRMCLTKNADSLGPKENRNDSIHRLANTMMRKLLDANYAHIHKPRWWMPGWL